MVNPGEPMKHIGGPKAANPKREKLVLLDKRINLPRGKAFHGLIDSVVNVIYEDFNIVSYFIMINFPGKSTAKAWEELGFSIARIEQLFESLPTAYAVLGVEMHRGTHSKRKKKGTFTSKVVDLDALLDEDSDSPAEDSAGFELDYDSSDIDEPKSKADEPSTLQDLLGLELEGEETPTGTSTANADASNTPNPTVKGNPHIHIFWSLYNGFLSPSESRIRFTLLDNGFDDVDVKSIEYSSVRKIKSKKFDVKRVFLYCIKESRDSALRELVRSRYNINYLSRIYYGLTKVKPYMERIKASGLSNDLLIELRPLSKLNVLPSVRPLHTPKVCEGV